MASLARVFGRGLVLLQVCGLVASVEPRLLNDSYAEVKFCQSQASINSYSLNTMKRVADLDFVPWGYLRNAFTSLAQWDAEHGTTTFKEAVQSANAGYAKDPGNCHTYWNIPYVLAFNDLPQFAALGALAADAAYGGTQGLQDAIGVFDFVQAHGFISQQDIAAGYLLNTKTPAQNLQATCNGESMVGGVYWQNGCKGPGGEQAIVDPKVLAGTGSLHGLLGASLCRLTGNQTYCQQAYTAMQWLDRHMLLPDHLIGTYINATDCAKDEYVEVFNAGLYVAAYANLGNLTNNATALELATQTAIAAMSFRGWNDDQGVIAKGAGSDLTEDNGLIASGPALIRYLHQAYPYLNSTVQQAIVEYVNIQYWALTQLDANSKSNPLEYGRNWTGPGYVLSTNESEVASLDVLNALALNADSTFPNTKTTNVPVALLSNENCDIVIASSTTSSSASSPTSSPHHSKASTQTPHILVAAIMSLAVFLFS